MTNPPSPRFTGFIRDVRTSKRYLQQTFSQPTTTTSTKPTEEQSYSPRTSLSSASSVNSTPYQALQKTNEVLKTEIHCLTHSNEDNLTKLKLQFQQYDELQVAYKQLEIKYNQLLDIEERYKKQNEELKQKEFNFENEIKQINHKHLDEYNKQKQKIHSLENDLLAMKSTQNHHQDMQLTIERLQSELQLSIKERETTFILNTQLRTEITNIKNTNERLIDECEKLRTSLISKCDEYDLKQRENEQIKNKNFDLESMIKTLRDTNDYQRRLNDENEINKQELKRKQDDFEQFQKMHDATKREHQKTIHLLQEKIHDLERKTELQSLKHEEILLQFESLKKRHDRILPSSIENILSSNTHHNSLPMIIDSQTSSRDDSAPIDLRQRSNEKSAQIVVAKYSYEPLRFSPNDHPEIELPLKLGEYYLIYGDIDEDGFYDGRNLEGRYGLIPSNFIELIINPNDLPENTKHIIQKLTGKVFPIDKRISRRREQTFSLDSDVFINNSPASIPTVRQPINSSSSDISNDNLSYGKHIPYPTNLRIEKSLSNSVLIAWNSPLSNTQILGYQVLLDHSLYTTIRVNERTRALIENINLNDKSHRISIRTITQRGLSRDQECTLLLTNSKDLSYIPTDLRVDRITQTSAVVSWWPASNDIIHKLFVDDVEVQTLKPEIYRFKLSGLLPNTMHKVTIKAKPSVTPSIQQQLAASIEFRTTSFDESVEPPKRVQVISGPQSNTLLVSWEQPSSTNLARGYRVLIDGHHIQDITNPLNDHTVINLNTLHPGQFLTIRTLTDNGGESHDSTPIDLDDVLKKLDMDISSTRIANISKETFQTLSDNETTKSPISPTIINHQKTLRPLSTISQEPSTPPIVPSPINKSLTRSSLESTSTTSSISTDVPQIELKSNSPKTLSRMIFDLNRIRTSINENSNINKSTSSEEQQRSTTINKNKQLQSSLGINNHLLNKINSSPKLFMALFDYDPHAMSPNQNNDEELPFKKGQIIKIYGDQDADGFYIGQTENGHTGYVPSNMISEIEVDHSETESNISAVSPTKRTSTHSKSIKKMIALFDYNPTKNSPNTKSNDELSFHSGDIIYIHGNIHNNGFYSGELLNGKKGLVPSNYLKEIPDEKSNNETNENKQSSINVNNEVKTSTIEPLVPTEAPQLSFFERLKNTFSWKFNEPI